MYFSLHFAVLEKRHIFYLPFGYILIILANCNRIYVDSCIQAKQALITLLFK